MKLHKQLERNEGKLHATHNNVRMLVREALKKGVEPQAYVIEHTQSWHAPENKGDAYARTFARLVGGITIGELDQIIKEETEGEQ